MFLRYFAATDLDPSTELGAAALAWCPFLLALDIPVRLVSARVTNVSLGAPKNPWKAYRDLLLTPMDGPFVNVCCVEPDFWKRLWTKGRTNVLLCPFTTPVEHPQAIEAALAYEVIVVPTEADAELWRAVGGSPHVLVPTADRLEDFRMLLGL